MMKNDCRNTNPAGDQPAAGQTPSNERRTIRRQIRSVSLNIPQGHSMRARELASMRYLGLASTRRETQTPHHGRSTTTNSPAAPSRKADSPISKKTTTAVSAPKTPETPENKGPEAHQQPDSNTAQSRVSTGSEVLQLSAQDAPGEHQPDPCNDDHCHLEQSPAPPMWIPGYGPTKDQPR